jgi:hypothetical protein
VRYAASIILLLAAAILFLTWQAPGGTLWIWDQQRALGSWHLDGFRLKWMSPADLGFRIAALVLIAAALISWPRRKPA